jgi:hypothetical protein
VRIPFTSRQPKTVVVDATTELVAQPVMGAPEKEYGIRVTGPNPLLSAAAEVTRPAAFTASARMGSALPARRRGPDGRFVPKGM